MHKVRSFFSKNKKKKQICRDKDPKKLKRVCVIFIFFFLFICIFWLLLTNVHCLYNDKSKQRRVKTHNSEMKRGAQRWIWDAGQSRREEKVLPKSPPEPHCPCVVAGGRQRQCDQGLREGTTDWGGAPWPSFTTWSRQLPVPWAVSGCSGLALKEEQEEPKAQV